MHKQLVARPTGAIALALIVFAPALWSGLAADDFTMLVTVEGVGSPLAVFERNDLGQAGGAGHFYRPLWVLLNAAVIALSGDSATALHALNLALFAIVVAELWVLARILLGARAWIAAIAFAVYPRHAESVAWISGNTDLLAAVFTLGAVLCACAPWPLHRRIAAAAVLTALGGLTKEAAFLAPALAAVILVVRGRPRDVPDDRLWLPLAMAVGLVPVLVARTLAIGGLGGYGEDPVTPLRVVAATVSYLVAAITPHQLEVLIHPALLAVPLALATAAMLAGRALTRAGADGGIRRRALAAGLAWFALSLLPVLGQVLDLNNATGERLLFLPSVGLAVAFAALVPERPRRAARATLAVAALASAALTTHAAAQWSTATDIGERTVEQIARAAPPNSRLVLLAYPESYRNAHIFTNSLPQALARSGRSDVVLTLCLPVHLRSRAVEAITATRRDGAIRLETGADAPFDLPVVGEPGALSPGCSVEKVDRSRLAAGLELAALARPAAGRAFLLSFPEIGQADP